jgi:hypothetical protein
LMFNGCCFPYRDSVLFVDLMFNGCCFPYCH